MSNELDKQFSDRLRGYESAVDAEALWQAVKPPRKKRPWAWLWLLVVGGIMLLSAAWWYLDSPQENRVIASSDAVALEWTAKAEEPVNAVENHIAAEIPSTTPDTDNFTAKTTTSAVAVPTTSSTTELLSTVTHANLASSAIGATTYQETKTTDLENTIREVAANDLKLTSSNLRPTAENANTENPNSTSLETVETFSRSQHETASLLPSLDVDLLPTQINEKLPSLCSTAVKPSVNKRSPWFLQLDAGYYKLQRSLSTNDSIGTDWLNKREQTESLLEANSLDITIGYHLSNKWELRTGFAYTQINTAFNYTVSSTVVDTVEGLQVLVYQGETVIDSIFGPVPRYTSILEQKRTYNSFRQWEVPLLLAYNFGAGRLHYQAEAGLRLLVQRQWEGNVISTDNEFVDLEETGWYRNKLALNYQFGLKAIYDLSPRISILAGVSARYSPQHFTTDDAPFKERYQLLGASISLRHKF